MPLNVLKMNTPESNDKPAVVDACKLPKETEDEVMQLAACGFNPGEIAEALEMPREKALAFVAMSKVPGSYVAKLINAGKVTGRATPQMKLQAAASAGNIEAIKELQKIQARNLFNERVRMMDDDEL